MEKQVCEMCQQVMGDTNENQFDLQCQCANQQSPEFYVYESGSEVVWRSDSTNNFYVMRCGEMKYLLYNNEERDDYEVIKYTSDFYENNIRTDQDIEELLDLRLECVNNPWFEICHDQDGEWEYGDVFFELDEAIAKAIELGKEKGFMV